MKNFITDIILKIQRFSKKLDDVTLLTNQHWIWIDDSIKEKVTYFFKVGNELIIAQNGKVEKSSWELLGKDFLLIEREQESSELLNIKTIHKY